MPLVKEPKRPGKEYKRNRRRSIALERQTIRVRNQGEKSLAGKTQDLVKHDRYGVFQKFIHSRLVNLLIEASIRLAECSFNIRVSA